jgi:hypothetical protein
MTPAYLDEQYSLNVIEWERGRGIRVLGRSAITPAILPQSFSRACFLVESATVVMVPGEYTRTVSPEDADDISASDAAKQEGIAGSYDDLRRELGL